MALMVKCKNPSCGFEYPSANQMDEIAFQVTRLSNMSEECPQCKQVFSYDKPNYLKREEAKLCKIASEVFCILKVYYNFRPRESPWNSSGIMMPCCSSLLRPFL
jgi:hypothetical protein